MASARALKSKGETSQSSLRRARRAVRGKFQPQTSGRSVPARVDSSKERAASLESISDRERKERAVALAARVASLRKAMPLLRPSTRTSKATGSRVATLSWVSFSQGLKSSLSNSKLLSFFQPHSDLTMILKTTGKTKRPRQPRQQSARLSKLRPLRRRRSELCNP